MLHMLKKRIFSQVSRYRLGGIVIILLAYAPGVFKESFWSDDYPALMDPSSVADHIFRDARPTSAALFSLSYSQLGDPSNAWILRSFALIALLLIFLFVSKQVSKSKHGNLGIFSIAVAFCLPSFQMYIHWSITWFLLWAALASLYAFQLWGSKLISRKIFAVILLGLALTTYPPVALFFFSVIAVVNTLNQSKITKYISDVTQGLVLLIISAAISIIASFSAIRLAGDSPNARVAILSLSDIPEKIVWLISRPIVVGLRPFLIDSPAPMIAFISALPVLLIIALGVKRQSVDLEEKIVYRFFWLAFPLVLTLIPIIVTSDNQIEFRVLPGFSWGITVLAAYFLLVLIADWFNSSTMNEKLKSSALLITPSLLAGIGIVSINMHYSDLFEGPYRAKNAFLNAQISSCQDSGGFKSVQILPPAMPFPSLPRLGVFSMTTDLASEWVPKPNVELLLKQRNIAVPVTYLSIRPLETKATATECVIDLEEFRKLLIK